MGIELEVLLLPAYDDLPGLPSEVAPWLDTFDFTDRVELAGNDSVMWVTDDGIGMVPTGVGKLAAATTTAAIGMTDAVGIDRATIISAGIAGGPPSHVSIGSLVLATTLVDWDNKLRFDQPRTTQSVPIEPNPYNIQRAVVRLNQSRVSRFASQLDANALCEAVEREAANHSLHLPEPDIHLGTNLCGDELFHGHVVADQAETLVKAHGCGPYLSTEMEDIGTAIALEQCGLLDQYLSVRAISNPDRPIDIDGAGGFDDEQLAEGARVALAGLLAALEPAVNGLVR